MIKVIRVLILSVFLGFLCTPKVWATQADDASLEIDPASPAADPNPVAINDSTTVTFHVYLYYRDGEGIEHPAADVASQTYTIDSDGGTIISTSVPDGFTATVDGDSVSITATGGNTVPSFDLSATVSYSTSGIKTVTPGATVVFNDSSPKNAQVGEPNQAKVTAKKVDKVQYLNGTGSYVDVTNPLYVNKGATITFKAIPDPATGTWPANKPSWGGTGGATGNGETKAVTFNATGDKTVTAECGNTVTVNVRVVEWEVTLALNGGATISAATENDKHDAVVTDVGTDALGELPMGTGRTDVPFKDNSYICATEVIGTVTKPADLTGITYRFKRTLSYRTWTIKKNGANWDVAYRSGGGNGATPDDDTDSDHDDTTPSGTKKIYSNDASGIYLIGTGCAVNDYVMGEKCFTYIVEARIDNKNWFECGRLAVYQKILTKRKAVSAPENVVADWTGMGNTYSTTATNLQITNAKVKAVVGGDGTNINIPMNANQ